MPTRMSPRSIVLLPIVALVLLAGCGSSKTTTASAGGGTSSTSAGGAASSTSASAPSANAPVKTMSSSLGVVVVDAATGMTLYHFDKDTPGHIACTTGCVAAWPPMTVTATPTGQVGGGALGAVARPDGSQQLTWNGMPLYHFAGDKAPGDTKGDGVAGIWHAARADAAAGAAPPPTTAAKSGYGY